MTPEELLRKMDRGAAKAAEHAQQTGQNADDMLFSLGGDSEVQSIEDVNQSGDVMTFVCLRESHGTSCVVAGSRRTHCDGCGEAVYMSPATTTTFDKMSKKLILCVECMAKQAETGP